MIEAGQRYALDPTHTESLSIPSNHTLQIQNNKNWLYSTKNYSAESDRYNGKDTKVIKITLVVVIILSVLGCLFFLYKRGETLETDNNNQNSEK